MPKAQPRDLENYVTVAERIEKFYERYDEGSLQTQIVFDDGSRIVMQAFAYRSSDDDRPGIGTAEEIRGKGPVNQSSAVENCETSAWGRAIAALGFEVKKGQEIASREEMEQAEAERSRQQEVLPIVETIDAEHVANLKDKLSVVMPDEEDAKKEFWNRFKFKLGTLGVAGVKSWNEGLAKLTPAQAEEIDQWLASGGTNGDS